MERKSRKTLQKAFNLQSCVICAVRNVNCRTVQCSHQFCYRCLSKWGKKKGNCPICRQDIRKVFYKNKVIAPQYLQEFDQRILLSSDESIRGDEAIHSTNLNSQNELTATRNVLYPVYYFYLPFFFSGQVENISNSS